MKDTITNRFQSIFCILLFLVLEMLSCQANTPYFPEEDKKDGIADGAFLNEYDVWINGIKDSVYVARVQDPPWNKEKTGLDFGGNYYFSSFDVDKPVEIKIKSKKNLNNVVFRPGNIEVKNLTKSENEISFVIEKPVKLIIEPAGKNSPLLLFGNAPEQDVPDRNDPNVVYYGPGIHHPKDALISLEDNQTLYVAEGAVIHGGVRVKGENITICGRGIICGNEFVWRQFARNLISVEESNHVVIKDVILRGSATWTMPIRNSKNVSIENVKIVGGRAQNDDGINPCNSQDVFITNCFIRTDDDCIALKGLKPAPDNENVERITVENSILWCDRARIFLLGHESRAEYMRELTFKDIDIVHFSMTPFLLEPGENMRLENVVFENFRINGEGQKEFIRLKPAINQYMQTKVPGYIKNITFKNISVTGKEGPYKIQLLGADEEHDVRDVTFMDVSVLGQNVTEGYANLEIGDHVSKVTFLANPQ